MKNFGKNVRLVVSVVMFCSISACNSKNETDEYPAIKTGEKLVIAYPLTDIDVNAAQAYPILLQAGDECKITAEVSNYGNHSLRITPQRVSCINPELVEELDSTKISAAYIDKRILGALPNVRFQLYQQSW